MKNSPGERNAAAIIYVSGQPMLIEFTLPQQSVIVPEQIPLGPKPLPYVPGSAFYYPDHETDSSSRPKRTIHL